LATATADANSNFTLSLPGLSNEIRLMNPTEWRMITQDVSAPSLALARTAFSTTYFLSNTGFNSLGVPTLTSNDIGAFWTLQNTTLSNLIVTPVYTDPSSVAGRAVVGLPSSMLIPSSNSTSIVWTGSNYRQVDGADGRSWYRDASGGTSLTVTAATSGSLYRISALTALAVPTLASSNIGVTWDFLNTATSNLSVTLTGTTNIASPITIYPSGTYTIRWTGSNYIGTQDKDAPANPATWAASPAIQTVDMSANGLTRLTTESFVRAGSSFTPLDICGCQLWFDVADSTKVDLSGTSIIRLRDKSGFGYDASLTGPCNLTYSTPINGRLGVQYPITGPAAAANTRFVTPTFTSSSNQRTVFWAGRWATYSNAQTSFPPGFYHGMQILTGSGTTGYATNFGVLSGEIIPVMEMNATSGEYGRYVNVPPARIGPTNSNIVMGYMMDMSAGNRFLTYNGAFSNVTGGFGGPGLILASDSYKIGNDARGAAIGEVIMYSNALSSNDFRKMEGYLAWKWGIPLPSSHPYFSAPPTGVSVPVPVSLGTTTTDAYGNLQLAGSNSVRTGDLKYKIATTEVGEYLTVTSNDSGTLYRLVNPALSTITLPSNLAMSNAGTFWQFYNPQTANESITLAGTTDIASPITIYPGGTYMIRWTGSNYIGSQDKPELPAVPDDYVLVTAIANGAAYYTLNGTDWVASTFGGSHKATWTGSNWVSAMRRSADGINWRGTSGVGANDNGASSVAWNGKLAVFYNNYSGILRTSPDGSNWTTQSTGTVFAGSPNVDDITWGQDKFMAGLGGAGRTYHYAYSFDGITWYPGGLIWPASGSYIRPTRIRWNGSYWLVGAATSQTGITNIARSFDGFTWSNVGSITAGVTGLEWNGDVWLASTQGGLWSSPDGSNWANNYPSSIFNNGNGGDVAWSGSFWYALGCNASGNNWTVVRSRDAANWTVAATFPNVGNIFGPAISTRFATPVKAAPPPPTTLLVSEVSGTSLTLASSNTNRSFYLTNSGFNALSLPSTTGRIEGGNYWSIRNSTASQMTITLTNTLNLTSPLIIPSSNTQTLVVSRDTSNTILLL
jgi:hypothetical protein